MRSVIHVLTIVIVVTHQHKVRFITHITSYLPEQLSIVSTTANELHPCSSLKADWVFSLTTWDMTPNNFPPMADVFGGPFLDRKVFFFHGILKKRANFNIQSCSQHISPHFLIVPMLCKKLPSWQQLFLQLFLNIFFLGLLTNFYWFTYVII
jgi:hypothetical protein